MSLPTILGFIKDAISTFGHWLLWTRQGNHISLLRVLIAASCYGLAMAAWFLLRGGDRDAQKFFLEFVTFVFTIISVLEIADGVVLSGNQIATLMAGGSAAAQLVPTLLVDAYQKCKVGLVFAMYGWLAGWLIWPSNTYSVN